MEEKKFNFRDIMQIIQTLLLVVLVIEVSYLLTTPKAPQGRQPRKPSKPQNINVNINEITKDAHSIGNKDAKVTLVKFNSFSCGYCKRARNPFLQLSKKYPNDVRIVYKHFNRGNLDNETSQAIECAGDQDKFWEMYNTIFDKGSRGDMNKYAKDLGLNINKFKSCMKNEKFKGKITNDTMQGRRLGVRGTPSFILNKKLIRGYKPYDVLEKMVKEEL